jgi:hypothetical protein
MGMYGLEVRLWDYYDLEDMTDRFENVQGADARFMVSSVAYRFSLFGSGAIGTSILAGIAWLRRESITETGTGPLAIQQGFGALLGGGLTYRMGIPFIGVDARVYPTAWSGMEGGTPYTVTVGAGAAY